MNTPLRLTVIMTHPVQYYAPWFHHIAAHCPDIDLTVIYMAQLTPEQQGAEFDRPFSWDIPLTEGYRCRFLRSPDPAPANPAPAKPGRSTEVNRAEIETAIRDSRPDVALVPGWNAKSLLLALGVCRRLRIPVLYRGDTNLGKSRPAWTVPFWAIRSRLRLRCFDAYLSVGQRSREYLRRFGAPASRIFASPHCVDNALFADTAAPWQTPQGRAAARSSFGLGTDDFVLLFAGKVDAQKRLREVIQTLPRLDPKTTLLVAGTGPLEAECRAEAERLQVRVAWAGFLNQTAIGKAYAAADCLVLPGDESWGLVVNEALATGLPCIVSDHVGCAPDLITPGETGDIFRMGDRADLAVAVERVRAKASQGHDFAPACRARAATHSFERATMGLRAGCQAMARAGGHSTSHAVPRVIACCGSMVTVTGLERMVFEVLRGLREREAGVHCIVNSWENYRITPLAEQIGASWSIGYYRVRFDRHTLNPFKIAQFAWDIFKTSCGLLKDVYAFRPSHVIFPEFMSVLRNAPALALLRMLNVKVLLRLGEPPAPGRLYGRIWRWGVNSLVDEFICNSIYTHKELLMHGIPAAKASYIYNCVPSRSATGGKGAHRDPRKVVYAGQVIPPKGVDLLLDAMGILVARGYDARLDVIGRMEGWFSPVYAGYRERLRERASQPDLAGRVQFLGFREDVPAIFSSGAVHCCPSRPEQREGFGVVNLEAKQAGIPSVVTPVGALPELIRHGEDGWIASEVSASALADGLEYFLSDPERLERAGRAAQSSLEKFSRERFVESWWGVFQAAASVPPNAATNWGERSL